MGTFMILAQGNMRKRKGRMDIVYDIDIGTAFDQHLCPFGIIVSYSDA